VKHLEALARTKMLKGPPENKGPAIELPRGAPPKNIKFASEGAAEVAGAAGLRTEHFSGRTPSSPRGYSIKDVRQILSERLPKAPAYLSEVGEEEEER
jgi:hypothetical protein